MVNNDRRGLHSVFSIRGPHKQIHWDYLSLPGLQGANMCRNSALEN